ncbi:hypothetical protein [Streptomyces sp. NPDC005538]|uniref:hypothetical protein n=1 Tax=unclassified Streptomyces TaxID=2593676 RepID=UPI0033B45CEF
MTKSSRSGRSAGRFRFAWRHGTLLATLVAAFVLSLVLGSGPPEHLLQELSGWPSS